MNFLEVKYQLGVVPQLQHILLSLATEIALCTYQVLSLRSSKIILYLYQKRISLLLKLPDVWHSQLPVQRAFLDLEKGLGNKKPLFQLIYRMI